MKHFFLQAPCITFNLKVLGRSADVDLAEELVQQRRPETLRAELICHSGEWETCPRCAEEAVRQLTLTDMQSYISHRGKLLPGEAVFFSSMLWYKSPNPVRSQTERPGLIKKKKKR